MSSAILDTSSQKDLILLIYSETLPYTTHNPPGITVDVFSNECERLKIDVEWRKNFWKKQRLHQNKILIYIGKDNKNVRCFTKGLRNAFAHCSISMSNDMVYAKCHQKYERGTAKGWKVFELYLTVENLKALLTFIKERKN